MPKIYDGTSDQMIDATQEWCDGMHKSVNLLAGQRKLVREILNLNMSKSDDVKLMQAITEFMPVKEI